MTTATPGAVTLASPTEAAADLQTKVSAIVNGAAFMPPVETEEEAEEIAGQLKACQTMRKAIEDRQKKLLAPIKEAERQAKGIFSGLLESIRKAEETLRASVLPYQLKKREEEEARVREAQRIQREAEERARREAEEREARARLAREEAERLEREAAQARSKKARAEAEAKAAEARANAEAAQADATVAADVAEAVAAPVNIAAQSTTTRSATGASLGLAMVWTHEVVAPELVPDRFWVLDDTAIRAAYKNEEARRLIADADGMPTIPGVRIFQKPVQRTT